MIRLFDMKHRVVYPLLLVLISLVLAGCGYSYQPYSVPSLHSREWTIGTHTVDAVVEVPYDKYSEFGGSIYIFDVTGDGNVQIGTCSNYRADGDNTRATCTFTLANSGIRTRDLSLSLRLSREALEEIGYDESTVKYYGGLTVRSVKSNSTLEVVEIVPDEGLAGYVIFRIKISHSGESLKTPTGSVYVTMNQFSSTKTTTGCERPLPGGNWSSTEILCAAPVFYDENSVKIMYPGDSNTIGATLEFDLLNPIQSEESVGQEEGAQVDESLKSTSVTMIERIISPNYSLLGDTAIFYVVVTGDDGGIPTGSVEVNGAGGSCTAALDEVGTGNCSYEMNQEGQHIITATYYGDENYEGSEGTASYGVLGSTDVPDSDGDGIPDDLDECPNDAGDLDGVDATGCPYG